MDLTFEDPRVRRTAHLVHSLARDLRRLEQNIPPTFEQMLDAPVINNWMLSYKFEPALTGIISGHPVLASGPAVTSAIFYLDRQAGFARTLSRYYRLGKEKS